LGLSQRRGPLNPRRPLYYVGAPWALGPSLLESGVWGRGWPALSVAATAFASPLATALGSLGGGVRCTPSLLYKGTPRGGAQHNTQQKPRALLPPTWCTGQPLGRAHLHLSLSPLWPLERLRRLEIISPLHAVVLWSFRISSNIVYFRNSDWIRDSRGHRDHRMCASTGGAAHAAPKSFLQDLHDLEVGYIVFIVNVFGLPGYITKLLFTVTTLLVYRSLGNSGLCRNKKNCYLHRTPTMVSKPDRCVICLYG
jgi:hypothetical protein